MKNLLNSVRLIGNVGGNPEVKEFEGGKKLAKLNLATNEKVTLGTGTVVENTQWHRDRKSTRLNSSHIPLSRMPSSA